MDTSPALHAYLSYRDADAALTWLEHVGFEIVTRQDDPNGAVLHAEVRAGDVVLMIATADAPYDTPTLQGASTGAGLYLWMPSAGEVDSWYAKAITAGAVEIFAPEDTEWGTRRCRVLDPEGREWSAGTYRPGTTMWI